ncbi:MAG: TIGR01212 family radical SAM protein [Anaerovoracaceae bacterium]
MPKNNVNPDDSARKSVFRAGPYGDMAAERMYTVNRFLRETFGRKMIKLAIDGGFTCPTRDGTKGTGGCLFCGSGAGGDFAGSIDSQIRLLEKKWPDAGYLAYFQNHTNTYAPVPVLRQKYEAALSDPRIRGIVIATRPDCLPDDVLDLLSEIRETHFLWVELGLQTAHDSTAERIGRGFPLSVYRNALRDLTSRGIRTVTHLINGLPGESHKMMRESARFVADSGSWGIKLHLLNVVRGSRLAEEQPDYVPFSSIDEYVSLTCDIIEELPQDMVIHRLTADAPRKILIAPEWSYKKRTILNGINHELRRRGTYQGYRREHTGTIEITPET